MYEQELGKNVHTFFHPQLKTLIYKKIDKIILNIKINSIISHILNHVQSHSSKNKSGERFTVLSSLLVIIQFVMKIAVFYNSTIFRLFFI